MQEIERKWLVARPPGEVGPGADGTPIRQGYLTGADGDPEVRLRDRGGARQLTVKVGAGLSRDEFEIAVDDDTFEGLWAHTGGARVEKVRHELPVGPYTAELDVYAGDLEGLMTVEVEFPSAAAADSFTPPAWFGRDVTGDDAYANRRLAREGLPPADG
ncbi:CYTH domain-containing protein [Euzebya sp.]|uniref:CYTH domain-containing protein n=1 Tax=Euzebya sp. TaxID=1971409 RepID=UPI0035133B3A